MAKSRVKITDFTNRDKTNLLELFVNNEKTLLKIYEILFPHRAGPNVGIGVTSSMVNEAGGGIYGQQALRALTRGSGRSQGAPRNLSVNHHTFQNHHQRLTAGNDALLSSLQTGNLVDYNSEMMKHGGFMPNNFQVDQPATVLPSILSGQKQNTQNLNTSNSKTHVVTGAGFD